MLKISVGAFASVKLLTRVLKLTVTLTNVAFQTTSKQTFESKFTKEKKPKITRRTCFVLYSYICNP